MNRRQPKQKTPILSIHIPGYCKCCICQEWKKKKAWDHEIQGFLCIDCLDHDIAAQSFLDQLHNEGSL